MLRHSGSVIPVLALALLATTCGDKSPESPRCRLAVVSPNGGEWLVAGSVHTILWSTDGPCGSQVRLELIRDGAVCDTIAAAIPDTGEHAWLCSPCGADSLAYRVRVVVLPGGQADASDGEFSIRSRPAPVCSLRLTAPLGGERVRVGETLLVAWEAGSACGDSVRLELLRDGLACATIAAAAAAATSFAWAAEPCGGDSSGYSIRVTDPAWGVADESPGTFVIVPPPAEACALGLVSPNGGETYTAGDPVSIAWESSGACADSVTLELLRDGSHCATIAVCPGGDGVYTWIAEPCGPAASGYAVRVSESSAPRPAGDTSDGTFAILPAPLPCHLALLSPGDGMAFRAGDGVAVSWSASGACADSVSIELLRAGTPCALLAAATPNDGSFDWIAVPCAGESEGYALRVRERGGSAAATSAGVFRIDPAPVPCSLTLIAPAGGGVYEMGAELPIAWSSHGDCADSVGITLLLDGVPCDTLALSTANDGGFAWIVAPCGPAGGGFTIRVAERGGTAADESAAPFVIVEPPSACGIEILAPAGGAALRVGEGLEIAWSASGTCGSWVRVDLLLGEGVCLPIAASTENDGSLAWVVQRCGENAEGYRLRVTDLASGLAFESAAPFSITTPCAIELTAPNGGEVFCPGESVAIAWQTRGGCGQTVSVELLFDGEPCATIAAATENDGHFSWTADACAGPGSGYAVRVTDPQTGAGDASDDVWAIEQPCALSLLHPSGGELLCTGSECLIAWQSGSCCGQTVLLELLHEGVVCQTIAAAASNSGEYAWVVAPCPGADEGYRVRVTDPLTLQSAESGETLRIAPECELRVTAPASGQSFCPGDAVAIAWERGACCGELVRIELLRNDEVCAEIAGETENDGSYEWPAAACAGGPDGYQVRVTDLSTLRSADGEGPFEIAGECALTVTSPNGGETLCVGRTVTLHWDAGACCGTTVALELLHEDAVCALIAPAAPNTGSYAFTVFSCGPGGGGYRLRVTDAAGVASDASDATFSILTDPCALRVTAPAGGERLSPGETLEIAWESSTCCGGAVRLELYRDGSFCRTIAATTPNDGRHTWIVEQCDGLDGNYVLRVRDLLTGAWGESDNHFRIAPYFVCWDGTGEFPSIQAALDAAPEGAIIELCDGTFPGSGNRNLDFRGKSLTLRSRSGNRDACILDCANGGSGIVFDEGEGPLAVVEGITIRRASQGAIVCRNGAAPTIRNCVLRDNVHSAYPGGAGILSESSSPSFTHCTIQDNTLEGGAIAGAGGYLECSEVSFKDCRFLGNRSVNVGGGLNVHGGRLVMEDCFFQGNETSNPGSMGGGGVAVSTWPDCPGEFEFIACRFESNGGFYGGAVLTGGPSRFSGCVFLGNSAGGRGGAISSESGSTLNAIDCLFENNDAGEYGGGCYLWDTDPNAADAFNNCTFRRNISGMGGGGLYIFDCGGAHGTMTVRDCVFEENLAGTHPSWGGGGGAWSFYDNTEFIHCTFTGNQAARGGALLLFYSPAQVRDCEFLDNRATYASGQGGGVLCWSTVTQPAFTSCRFDGNEAPMGGGLAFIEGAGGSLTQCEIVSGRAGRGGGVYCQGAEPRFELCRLVGNRAEGTAPDGLGGGAYVEAAEGDAVPSFVECTLQGNRASVDGGGAYLKLDGRWDSIEFAECTFIENFATARGGALASAAPGSVHLAACDIRLNFAQEGGAISGSGGASIRAADSDFVYNEAWLHGGGLHLQDADATLVGSRFRANSAGGAGSRTAHYGGVAAVFGGRLTMESCQCTANYADTHGGAVYSSGGYGLETLACLFEGNQVGTDGGALFLAGGTQHSLHSTIFRLNEAGDDGGAIVVRDVTQLTASWCQFDRNSADDDGGAIYAYDRVTLGLRNSTFSLNRAPDGGAVNLNNQCAATVDNSIFAFSEVGAAFHCPGGSTAVLACCDVFGNAGGDWVGCLLGQDAGAGNISLDPLFCDKEQGDLSVGGASPCAAENNPECGKIGAEEVGCP